MRIFVDSHCDTPTRLLEGVDITTRCANGHFDFVRMAQGGVDCVFFALYTPNDLTSDAALRRVMLMLAHIHEAIDASAGKVAMAFSSDDIVANKRCGVLSIALGMENALPADDSLVLLGEFRRMGVRYVTLTHNGNNLVCDSAASEQKRWHGLSPFGRQFVARMNDLGMIVDVSHISDDSLLDVLECSRVPVVASHSCCRAISEHPRNLSDELIASIAAKGGVVQINFYPLFLDAKHCSEDSTRYPSVSTVVDHIDHVVKVAGIDHVGIGTDFDGIEITPRGLEDISMAGKVLDELSSRGYSSQDVDKIAGGNFLRVLKAAEIAAK